MYLCSTDELFASANKLLNYGVCGFRGKRRPHMRYWDSIKSVMAFEWYMKTQDMALYTVN